MNLIQRLHEKSSPNKLSLLRIIIGLQVFNALSSEVFQLMDFMKADLQLRYYLSYFPKGLTDFISDNLLTILLVGKIACFFVILGLLTRVALWVLFVSFLFLYNHYFILNEAPIQWVYLLFPIFVLGFSNSHHKYSLDSYFFKYKKVARSTDYNWPIEFFKICLVCIYFSAGVQKVFPLSNIIPWSSGETIRVIMMDRFLDSPLHYLFEQPIFNYAQYPELFRGLAISSILLELSVIMIIFTSRYNLVIFLGLFGFHVSLLLLGVAGFLFPFVTLSIALIPCKYFDFFSRGSNIKPSLG